MNIRSGCMALLLAAALAGCGGNGGETTTMPTPAPEPPPPPPPPPDDDDEVSAPVVVTVDSGTQSGVDIAVASKPAGLLNAELLGVTEVGEGGSASNTGATIQRGRRQRVLLFGANLDQTTEASVAGRDDIIVEQITAIESTEGTPGVSFIADVSNDAALGARTVILRDGNKITVFAGGLEVIP